MDAKFLTQPCMNLSSPPTTVTLTSVTTPEAWIANFSRTFIDSMAFRRLHWVNFFIRREIKRLISSSVTASPGAFVAPPAFKAMPASDFPNDRDTTDGPLRGSTLGVVFSDVPFDFFLRDRLLEVRFLFSVSSAVSMATSTANVRASCFSFGCDHVYDLTGESAVVGWLPRGRPGPGPAWRTDLGGRELRTRT